MHVAESGVTHIIPMTIGRIGSGVARQADAFVPHLLEAVVELSTNSSIGNTGAETAGVLSRVAGPRTGEGGGVGGGAAPGAVIEN